MMSRIRCSAALRSLDRPKETPPKACPDTWDISAYLIVLHGPPCSFAISAMLLNVQHSLVEVGVTFTAYAFQIEKPLSNVSRFCFCFRIAGDRFDLSKRP